MRLRTVINRPARFGEEDYSRASFGYSPYSKAAKSTAPSFPELLSRVAAVAGRPLSPAAFPSLPLNCNTCKEAELEAGIPIETNLSSTQQQLPTLQQNGGDSSDQSEGLRDEYPESTQIGDAGTSRNSFPNMNITDEMRTSPIQPPSDLVKVPAVSWSGIEPGLQLYIFESLLGQFQYPEIVGEVLGLNSRELRGLMQVKNERDLQPETTEDLWDYCCWLGGNTKGYIKPHILQRYIDYFAYAARFENASLLQRQVAVAFLKQRNIEAGFVDALLPRENSMWVRPDPTSQEWHIMATVSSMNAQSEDDKERWAAIISNTLIHESHDVDMVAAHFKCSYFPSGTRIHLLGTPLGELDPFERWLLYGSTFPTQVESNRVTETSKSETSETERVKDPLLRSLSTLFYNWDGGFDFEDPRLVERQQETHAFLCALTRAKHQSGVFRRKIEEMHLTSREKQYVLEAARKYAKAMLTDHSSVVVPMSPDDRSISASRLDAQHEQANATLSADIAEISGSRVTQGYPHSATPEPHESWDSSLENEFGIGGPVEKPRSLTLSTDATLPLIIPPIKNRQHHRSKGETLERWQDEDVARHNQPLSEEPYHTAPEVDDDRSNIATSRHSLRRSPSPPPWSPISDSDSDDAVSQSRPNRAQSVNPISEIRPLLPRNTP